MAAVPYVVEFDVAGLPVVFSRFMRLDTRAEILAQAPTIYDIGDGAYVFYRTYDQTNLFDLYFQVDSGAARFDRYRSGVIGPWDEATAPTNKKILALVGANRVVDQEVLDEHKRMTSARIRIYDTAAHAALRGSTGVIGTYAVAASYTSTGACIMTVTEA